MIFVTVGTQSNGFIRCLNEVEKLIDIYDIEDRIVAQIGNTNFSTDKFEVIPFVGETDFKEYINQASVVITHAGSGAIFNSIKAGKKTIAMARLHEFNEMVDNHQLELVNKLSKEGYIIDGSYSLIDAWKQLNNFVPRKNDFHNEIISNIQDVLDEWINA